MHYDRTHIPLNLKVGEYTLLRLHKGYHIPSVASRKLGAQRVGPFKVLGKVGNLVYRLDFPPHWKIHRVISISHHVLVMTPTIVPGLPSMLLCPWKETLESTLSRDCLTDDSLGEEPDGVSNTWCVGRATVRSLTCGFTGGKGTKLRAPKFPKDLILMDNVDASEEIAKLRDKYIGLKRTLKYADSKRW